MPTTRLSIALIVAVCLALLPTAAFSKTEPQSDQAAPGDEYLQPLADGQEPSVYRAAYERLSARAGELARTATSPAEHIAQLTALAPAMKVVYTNLADSSAAADVQACVRAFDFYVICLALEDKDEELAALATSEFVTSRANLKARAKAVVKGGARARGYLKAAFGYLMPFIAACEHEDVDPARRFGALIVEEASTNDSLFDELDTVLQHAVECDPNFALELVDDMITAYSHSDDAKRRDYAEQLVQRSEKRKRAIAGKKRFQELLGNELKLEGLLLGGDELDWSQYRGKVTLVVLGVFRFGGIKEAFPQLLQLYQRYHDTGLEILLYSDDFEVGVVEEFQNEVKLPWKIAMWRLNDDSKRSGGKEYVDPFEYYSVEAVFTPQIILVDRDGKVVATDLEGDQLEKALKKEMPDVLPASQETLDACRTSLDALFTIIAKPIEDELKKKPKDAHMIHHLAAVYDAFGRKKEGTELIKKALEIEPNSAELLNCLAFRLATDPEDDVRDGALALEYAERAAKAARYEVYYVLDTLAAAYAELGDFENAVKWAKKALDLATLEGLEWQELQSYRDAVELYRHSKPRRE